MPRRAGFQPRPLVREVYHERQADPGGVAALTLALMFACRHDIGGPSDGVPEGRRIVPHFQTAMQTSCEEWEFWGWDDMLDTSATVVRPSTQRTHGKCGDLPFMGETADFDTLIYKAVFSGDTLWHLWRRGRRLAYPPDSVIVDTLYDRIPHPIGDTSRLYDAFPTTLSGDLDIVGIEWKPLLYRDEVEVWPAAPAELYAQFWRHIPPPTGVSARVSALDSSVVITWHSNHFGKDVDSTEIFRLGGPVPPTRVRSDAEEHVDSPPDTGVYVYEVRHTSPELLAFGPARPTSELVPDTIHVLWTPHDLSCGRQGGDPTRVSCAWQPADATTNTQIFRNDSLRATVGPGVTSHTDTALATTVGAVYTVRHESQGDVTEFSLPDTVWGTITATPAYLSCGGCVKCIWVNGDSGLETEIWRSLKRTWGYAIRDTVAAGLSGYTDTQVDSLKTYYYKVRHIAYLSDGPYSNIDPVKACALEPLSVPVTARKGE